MEQVLLRNMVPEDAAKLAELANNKKIWYNGGIVDDLICSMINPKNR